MVLLTTIDLLTFFSKRIFSPWLPFITGTFLRFACLILFMAKKRVWKNIKRPRDRRFDFFYQSLFFVESINCSSSAKYCCNIVFDFMTEKRIFWTVKCGTALPTSCYSCDRLSLDCLNQARSRSE